MDLFSDTIKIDGLDKAVKLFNESRAGFLKLFDASPICMSMTTISLDARRYVRVNKCFIEKFGYSKEEILNRTSTEIGILSPSESERVRLLIIEKGGLRNDYIQCITKQGEIVHTISSIEFMEMGDQTLLVSFFIDVSTIIEQQRIIEKNAQQLEAVNKELEAFSYSISHDLRAPLRSIDGYARILEEDFHSLLDKEGQKILKAVQDNARQMNALIEHLLEFAKLGKRSMQKYPIDMNVLLEEVLTALAISHPHHAKVKVGRLHGMEGDYTLMRQVLSNLVSNAIKYSSKRDEPVVEIMSNAEGEFIIYTIRDNGTGFDMEYVDKLFGVFQRLHKSSEFEGIGIGLAIAQRIVAKHGGTIHAEAKPGEGACFYFRIPITHPKQ